MSTAPEDIGIVLRLNGPHGRADLSDFATAVSALRNSLGGFWRCVGAEGEMVFEVFDLTRSSAVITTTPAREKLTVGMNAAALFKRTVRAIELDEPIDPVVDYSTLHALNGFSGIARKESAELSIAGLLITTRFADRMRALLQPDSKAMGSVTGRLEGINLHGNSRFILYPSITGEQVDCIFPREQLPEVLEAVDRNVTVYGALHYAKTKIFPIRVDVDSFEIQPLASDLPTLLNACGLMNSPQSSVDMIREVRNEW